MSRNISKIAKVEIKSLWNRFDLSWTLNPDVNILSGINGSGKSTILDCTAALIAKGILPDALAALVQSVKITFDNGEYAFFEHIKDTIKNLELRAKKSPEIKNALSNLKEIEGFNYNKVRAVSFGVTSWSDITTLNELHSTIEIDKISTFDNPIQIGRAHV